METGIIRNPELFRFWVWCLLKASRNERTQTVGYQQVKLFPGQFVFGRNAAADELATTPRKIRTCINALIKSQNVTIKTTSKFSVISIVNWDIYQHTENQNDQQNDQQVTSKRPASDHKQECKESKNEKNTYELPKGNLSIESVSVDYKMKSCPHKKIIESYHKHLKQLPNIQIWDKTSEKNLSARWKEDQERQCIEFWDEFFQWVSKSDFLTGRVNHFRADLHWLVKPSNFAKVINGRYHNKKTFHDNLKSIGESWLKKQKEMKCS